MPSSPRDEAATKSSLDAMSADERTLCENTSDDGYNPSEVSDDDHDILESEDERERLLTQKEGFSGLLNKRRFPKLPITKRYIQMAPPKTDSDGETSALMYDMEEGEHGVSSSSKERRSSEEDERRLLASKSKSHTKTRRSRIWRRTAIYTGIVALFVGLLFAAYRVSRPAALRHTATMVSNGTSLFAPTTILISLDGFRADFLYRGLTPTLSKFVAEGISPKYMLPSFPSVTFPNHFTMATGLYPEAHGVVGNTFWDPAQQKEFYYTDPERSLQAEWWGGEPIWRTAERQDVRVAVHMWPGSEVHSEEFFPAYVDKYNGSEALPRKVDRIMELLDIPGPEDIGALADKPRPQLIAAYVPNVDGDGHKYGPNSTEIRQTIMDADTMLGDILKGLQERNLTDIVNVVVVSDHGMATTDTSRLIQLEDLVDPAELEHIDGWPHYGLRPKKMGELERLHKQIVDRAQNMSSIEIYLRDVDMPERYHFSQSERIAPLWIIPKAGWAIVDKSEGNVEEMVKNGDVYHPRGIHGYDHEHPLMRAIFVARGPAFPHQANSRMEAFQNIELYNIICDSIGIDPAPNNGTLRLPLTPVGLHTDLNAPSEETPADPVDAPTTTPNTGTGNTASSSPPSAATPSPSPSQSTSPTSDAPPAETSKPAEESWWEWLTHKAENAEEWVDNFLHTHLPGNKEEGDGESKVDESGGRETQE